MRGNASDPLAEMTPEEITPAHVQAWIAENSTANDESGALAPKSLAHYLSSLRQVLDFCDITSNPARSPRVKLPESEQEEIAPPRGRVGKDQGMLQRQAVAAVAPQGMLRATRQGDP